jgi:hypothetical protein
MKTAVLCLFAPRIKATLALVVLVLAVVATAPRASAQAHTEARLWNDMLLDSIRHDLARPTVHARNLYHTSVAMYDAWATYDLTARTVLFNEKHPTVGPDVDTYRSEAISYAMYRILLERFSASPGAALMLPQYDALMAQLGYDKTKTTTVGNSPAAIGNRIAATIIAYGLGDNSNEQNAYKNQIYVPKNPPLIPPLPGNPTMIFPNLWQPLALDFFIDQGGNPIPGGYPGFLSAEWGKVKNFALADADLNVYQKDNADWYVYHDPGQPFLMGTDTQSDYQHTFALVSTWSSHLDPTDGVMMDASPNGIGKAVLPATNDTAGYDQFYDMLGGGDNGTGYAVNPVTGQPYAPQIVPRGDYARCLAEFWADGPTSETPPGHWFTILNGVSDSPALVKKIGGTGPTLSALEWDVKCYLALGGAMHDCAVTCWGIKGWYDGVRPVSAIRYMADRGQCTDTLDPSFNPAGLPLIPDFIEIVTADKTAPGEKLETLQGYEGKIAIKAWRGPPYITNPATEMAGVGWILAENWWPYQRPTFVTPPFGGYTSGHSTYSRAGAVIMTSLTGSKYFPGGLGEFVCPQNQYLVFEEGPSVTVKLQWVSYFDASDQCSLSRIWGGIHPPMDDIPSRKIGEIVGADAFSKAEEFWSPWSDAGPGLAGVNGVPSLAGTGTLEGGSVNGLNLSGAKPFASAVLGLSLTSVPVPFKGGTFTAHPLALVVPMVTLFDGTIPLSFTWPAGMPADTSIWFQYLVLDAAAVQGVSLSNALKAVTP